MATVAVLSIGIKANAKQFLGAIRQSSKGLQLLNQAGQLAAKGVLAFSAAATAAGAAVTVMVNKTRASLDTMAKLARATNTSVQDLQALQFGAELSGVSLEVLDKGLKGFLRRIGESARGTGEATEAFNQLGIDAAKLATLDTGTAFEQVIDAINQLPTVAQQADVAAKVFGRSGQEMLNLIRSGSTGVEGWRNEIKQLGASLNAIDLGRVEFMNDQITRAQAIWSATANMITVELAPVISAIVDSVIEWRKQNAQLGNNMRPILNFFLNALTSVQNVINKVRSAIAFLAGGINELLALLARAGEATSFTTENTEFFRSFREEFERTADEQMKKANRLWKEVEPPKFLDQFAENIARVNEIADRSVKRSAAAIPGATGAAASIAPAAITMKSQVPAIEALGRGQEETFREIFRLTHPEQEIGKAQLTELQKQTNILEGVWDAVRKNQPQLLELPDLNVVAPGINFG